MSTPTLTAHPKLSSRGVTMLSLEQTATNSLLGARPADFLECEPNRGCPLPQFHNAAVEIANQHEALKQEYFKLLAQRMVLEREVSRLRSENVQLRKALGGKKEFVFLE